ncbi:MAG: hypothetical protein K0R00_3940 [Herbinix sp.]|jgi:hypothetical protein|nr:hypothetical protein [Herbinix sp.]
MDHLLKQKEAIELQFQISEKFSEKANKHYRETVLRDFFTKNRAYVLSKGNQRFIPGGINKTSFKQHFYLHRTC